ncbi:MAG: hypothetical protein B6D61_04265 [Bacteroidetes bacterium 4484_249]|nr:MAG: hypothetical protein B6D61_04265 [Bacteroidetes bacterium 4484_249]
MQLGGDLAEITTKQITIKCITYSSGIKVLSQIFKSITFAQVFQALKRNLFKSCKKSGLIKLDVDFISHNGLNSTI